MMVRLAIRLVILDTLGAAEADYDAVRDFYLTSGLLDTYDAAVITRDDGGR